MVNLLKQEVQAIEDEHEMSTLFQPPPLFKGGGGTFSVIYILRGGLKIFNKEGGKLKKGQMAIKRGGL